MCYTGAIALFILTSLLIGMGFLIHGFESESAIIVAFLSGVIAVLAGVLYTFLDAKKAYEIVHFDVRVDE